MTYSVTSKERGEDGWLNRNKTVTALKCIKTWPLNIDYWLMFSVHKASIISPTLKWIMVSPLFENVYLLMTVREVFCEVILPQTAQLLSSLAIVHSFDWKQNRHLMILFCSPSLSACWYTQTPKQIWWRKLHQTEVQWRLPTQPTTAEFSKQAAASWFFLVEVVAQWSLLHPPLYFVQVSGWFVYCAVWCCLCQLYLMFLPCF